MASPKKKKKPGRVKTKVLQLLEKMANRIHPKNKSGNNVSRF